MNYLIKIKKGCKLYSLFMIKLTFYGLAVTAELMVVGVTVVITVHS